MDKVEILSQTAEFTWMFGNEWFVESPIGNFIWSDPDYNGDNTFTKTRLSYMEFANGRLGRDKGFHNIENFCGSDIIF